MIEKRYEFIKFPPPINAWCNELHSILSRCERSILDIPIGVETWVTKLDETQKAIWATNAIEGNTLTFQEVQNLICNYTTDDYYGGGEKRETINTAQVYAHMNQDRLIPRHWGTPRLDEVHKNLFEGAHGRLNAYTTPGSRRTYDVSVGKYLCPPHTLVGGMLHGFFQWLRATYSEAWDENIQFAIVRAMTAHVYFACIHPYGDGNGRMARAIERSLLVGFGIPPICADLLTPIYWDKVGDYYWNLHQSNRDGLEYVDVMPFLRSFLPRYMLKLEELAAKYTGEFDEQTD